MVHEGSRPVRKANVEMLEGQINRFIMYDDETSHEIFNQLKKLVNKARAIGYKRWTNRMVMKRLIMANTPMNYNVVTLICQDPAYKKMSSDDVLGRIMNHEINIQEANNIKNLYRASQPPRKKIMLSRQTRARRKKF
jgi:predicted GNAT family acetyltransferase